MLDHRVRTFMEVVDQGSFSLAAKRLFISAVSVKKQMDSLESELGTRLLERTNRGIATTAAGDIFYGSACRIQQISDNAIQQMRALTQNGKQVIKVGTSLLRPCSRLLDVWTRVGSSDGFSLEIVPFEDGRQIERVIADLGNGLDCFLGPCDAPRWLELCNVLLLGSYECAIAVPRQHRLASKASLTWDDLDGESLMLIQEGTSPVLDALRAEILDRHPGIRVIDTPHVYGIDTFNQCEREGMLMETLDGWRDVHPGFVTLPMEWGYRIPEGLFYSKSPSGKMKRFIELIVGETG